MDEVTAAQAAMLTGFSERTIRRKIASGELPARRLAPNRYAIEVSDLPQRWDDRDLARRLDALERRVRLVEEQQRILLRRVGMSPSVEAETAGEEGAAAEPDAEVGELRELLAQLAEQTERLGPLLGAPEPERKASSGRGGARQARGSWRTLRGGRTSQAGS